MTEERLWLGNSRSKAKRTMCKPKSLSQTQPHRQSERDEEQRRRPPTPPEYKHTQTREEARACSLRANLSAFPFAVLQCGTERQWLSDKMLTPIQGTFPFWQRQTRTVNQNFSLENILFSTPNSNLLFCLSCGGASMFSTQSPL